MSFPATTPTGMMGYGLVSGNTLASASTDISLENQIKCLFKLNDLINGVIAHF